MKLILRRDLPAAIAKEVKESRFMCVEPNEWGTPKILAHGNDPAQVAKGGVEPQTDSDGNLLAPHKYLGSSNVGPNVQHAAGVLYRIDETRRVE